MPLLEDSALVHGLPPRRLWDTRSSVRTAQRGTQSALAFVQGAFFLGICPRKKGQPEILRVTNPA